MNKEEKELVRKTMSLLGRIQSDKKKKTSRENGKKGGRPRAAQRDSSEIFVGMYKMSARTMVRKYGRTAEFYRGLHLRNQLTDFLINQEIN